MAAHGNKFIRVRLFFDYPPPAVADCRMCWLLVDLSTCRVVADVESLIREKFEFSRRSVLSLFIEDCYLPHTESVHVVRDNDSVRVKVDRLAQVNGHSSAPDAASSTCRKRQRPTEEEGLEENGLSVEWKKQKRKKRSEENLEREAKEASGEKSQVKKKKKKKKKKKVDVTSKPAASTQKSPAGVDKPVKSTKKPPVAPKTQTVSSSDSSSSSSEEDEAPKRTAAPKPAARTPSSTPTAASKMPPAAPKAPPAAPKTPPATKPTQKPPSSSSDSVSSSSDEDATRKLPKNKTPNANSKPQQAPPPQKVAEGSAAPPHDDTVAPPNSDSEDEIKLVIRRPVKPSGHIGDSPLSWRGRGRGQPRCGGPGERGRGGGGAGGGGHSSSSEFSFTGAKEPSCLTDALTNVSVVLQNKASSMVPRLDYSSLPLLAAPPQVGQRIAFKLLELTENYTPEVSEYKEGKILSFDFTTKLIELELLSSCQAPVEPGKFDLVYQNPDGSESVEYAVSRSSRVSERWDSLLEPRLII